MKPGFKPKLFTKKEWQDNRSTAAKGSGVGKALDVWQAKCTFNLKNATVKEIADAFAAASALDKALDVARKMCDPKAQKETIAGIDAYKDVVAKYQKALKAANSSLQKRKQVIDSLDFNTVVNDKELLAAFIEFAKKKAHIYEPLHTYLLWKAKKYEEAVKLYGKDNDYNVSNATNQVLLKAFGGRDRGTADLKVIAEAVKSVPTQMQQMLGDARHYKGSSASFNNYETFTKLMDKKFPITDFAI
jgi:hypothetical protein